MRSGGDSMQSKNSEINNSNQKLVLHMWEDSTGDDQMISHHDQQSVINGNNHLISHNKKHSKESHKKDNHRHHHRSKHRSHHHHSASNSNEHNRLDLEDRIDIYVQKSPLKGPPTKPKPSLALRKSSKK